MPSKSLKALKVQDFTAKNVQVRFRTPTNYVIKIVKNWNDFIL